MMNKIVFLILFSLLYHFSYTQNISKEIRLKYKCWIGDSLISAKDLSFGIATSDTNKLAVKKKGDSLIVKIKENIEEINISFWLKGQCIDRIPGVPLKIFSKQEEMIFGLTNINCSRFISPDSKKYQMSSPYRRFIKLSTVTYYQPFYLYSELPKKLKHRLKKCSN